MNPSRQDVTRILQKWSGGDEEAFRRLLEFVYDQLKVLAHARLRDERRDHTLNTSALVHEAYLKMVDINRVQWNDRVHFLAMASRVMRRILVDYALMRKAAKRGGGRQRVDVEEAFLLQEDYAGTVLEINDALKKMEKEGHHRQSKTMELHYFGGLTTDEMSQELGISPSTVTRDLRFARAWLAQEWKDDFHRPGK